MITTTSTKRLVKPQAKQVSSKNRCQLREKRRQFDYFIAFFNVYYGQKKWKDFNLKIVLFEFSWQNQLKPKHSQLFFKKLIWIFAPKNMWRGKKTFHNFFVRFVLIWIFAPKIQGIFIHSALVIRHMLWSLKIVPIFRLTFFSGLCCIISVWYRVNSSADARRPNSSGILFSTHSMENVLPFIYLHEIMQGTFSTNSVETWITQIPWKTELKK